MKSLIAMIVIFSILLYLQNFAQANHSSKQSEIDGSEQRFNYALATEDKNTVYNHYTQTGGREVRTKDSYFAYCQIWVQTTIFKLFANGFPRINPDNTYYAGDGFSYSFSYGWAGNKGCRNFKVCPVESSLGGESTRCDLSKIRSIKSTKQGSSSGMVELSAGNSGNIQLTVAAERYSCFYPKKARIVCGWTEITATGSYAPFIIKPNVEFVITQEPITDKDGFESGNLDGTYYLWDAVNLVHDTQYLWKEERFGTLSVAVSKIYDLKMEQEFQCDSKRCAQILTHQGFEPWQKVHQYGGGMTLLNATKQSEIGRHDVLYAIELFNLGRLIHKQQEMAKVLIVKYDPAYVSYPYLVLKDGHAFGWGNRPAIALYYLGSEGGGKDDTTGIHEKRRSKINAYKYVGYAFDPIVKTSLGQKLSWSSSGQVSESSCFGVESDSLWSGKTDSAMFVKKGFGKIAFSYPILHTMLSKRYSNATLENTLQSSSFAGFETKNLTAYKYQYPDLKFSNPVKILSYHSDGSRTMLPIWVSMVPDTTKGANYTHDYVCKKVFHDTKSKEFAAIVVGDMYYKKNQQGGIGSVNLGSKLTSTWFPPFYNLLAEDVFDLELNTGYGAPSPYKIDITVGQKTRTIHKILNFLSAFTHIVNLDKDNLLNVESDLGFIKILPKENFGEIVNVTVNGRTLNKDCTNGCTTTVSANQDLTIEAWNLWGGRATAFIKKHEASTESASYDWGMLATTVFVAAVGWLAYKLSRQAIAHFRNQF
ncbi:MAG: hypothetical protein QW395_03960 [Candidatus Nitrosotenuis sp.]